MGLTLLWRIGLFLLMLAALPVRADTLDFGHYAQQADRADYHDALVKALRDLAQPGHETLHIPPGTYPIYTHGDAYHLAIRGLTGKHITGIGATLLFKETKAGLLLENLHRVRIEGLTLNYAQLPQIQGTVLDREAREIRVRIDPLFRSNTLLADADRLWATLHDKDGTRNAQLGSRVLKVKSVTGGNRDDEVLVNLEAGARMAALQPGLRMVVVGRYRSAHAMTVRDTDDLQLAGLTVLSSPSMALLAQAGNRSLSLLNLRVKPDHARGALVSTNADGLHVIEPLGQLTIAGCRLEGLQDDAIVVSRRGAVGQLSRDGSLLNLHEDMPWLDPSQPVSLTAIRHVQGPQTMSGMPELQPDGHGLKIRLDTPMAPRSDHESVVVFARTEQAAVHIADNDIVNVRARGIRINYPGVVVQDNRISGTTGAALLAGPVLSGEQWQPQDTPDGLVVMDNRFESLQSGRAARLRDSLVEIAPFPLPERGRYGKVMRNITLLRNRFVYTRESRSGSCAIALRDVQGARLADNVAVLNDNQPAPPYACGIDAGNVAAVEHRNNRLGTESGL